MLAGLSDPCAAKRDHWGPRFYSGVEGDDSFATPSYNRERRWLMGTLSGTLSDRL